MRKNDVSGERNVISPHPNDPPTAEVRQHDESRSSTVISPHAFDEPMPIDSLPDSALLRVKNDSSFRSDLQERRLVTRQCLGI